MLFDWPSQEEISSSITSPTSTIFPSSRFFGFHHLLLFPSQFLFRPSRMPSSLHPKRLQPGGTNFYFARGEFSNSIFMKTPPNAEAKRLEVSDSRIREGNRQRGVRAPAIERRTFAKRRKRQESKLGWRESTGSREVTFVLAGIVNRLY